MGKKTAADQQNIDPVDPKKQKKGKKAVLIPLKRTELKKSICKKFQKNGPPNSDNLHKLQQKFQRDAKNDKFIKNLQAATFDCPICYQKFVYPVVTHCGHHFCMECFYTHSISGTSCPMCRAALDLSKLQSFSIIQKLVNKVIDPSQDELIPHLLRYIDTKSWTETKSVGVLKQGQYVDCYVWPEGWRKGIVVKVIKNNNQQVKAHVQSIRNLQFEGQFSLSQLASLGFYTDGKYLRLKKQSQPSTLLSNSVQTYLEHPIQSYVIGENQRQSRAIELDQESRLDEVNQMEQQGRQQSVDYLLAILSQQQLNYDMF